MISTTNEIKKEELLSDIASLGQLSVTDRLFGNIDKSVLARSGVDFRSAVTVEKRRRD